MDSPIRTADPAAAGRAWLALAIGSLVAAGGLAAALVVGRAPGFDRLGLDPHFFRRCLVVHVDLSLVAWQVAFLGALWCCLPAPESAPARALRGAKVAFLGLLLLVASALVPGAEPVLSNYIPAIDHPLFACGLVVLAGGLAMALLDGRLLAGGAAVAALDAPAAAATFLRAAALAALMALATFAATALDLPAGLIPLAKWERLAWGGGHVLQFAGVAAMLACWQILLDRAGARPMPARLASILAAVLGAPLLLAPVLALRTDGGRHEFTRLMEFGIAPVVIVAVGWGVFALLGPGRRHGHDGARSPHIAAFAASAGLTLVGFALGFSIAGSNTVVPAHYHAAIGGVTAAFMAVAPLLLPALGFGLPSHRARRIARWQPAAFAVGQAVFAAGFALAGAHGAARKVYGAEQARTAVETAGLGVMAIGGLLAVVAGLAFLGIVGSAIARGAGRGVAARRLSWKNESASAASRS